MGKFLDYHLYLPLLSKFFVYEYIVLIIRKKCIQRNPFLCGFLRGVNYYDNILNSMKKFQIKNKSFISTLLQSYQVLRATCIICYFN